MPPLAWYGYLLQRAMAEFFGALLSLAQLLVRSPGEAVAAAGAHLFVTLFTRFTAAYNQQVRRELHLCSALVRSFCP